MALYSVVWLLLLVYLTLYPGIQKVLKYTVLNLITYTTDLMTQSQLLKEYSLSYNPTGADLTLTRLKRGPLPIVITFKSSDFSAIPDFCNTYENVVNSTIFYQDESPGEQLQFFLWEKNRFILSIPINGKSRDATGKGRHDKSPHNEAK